MILFLELGIFNLLLLPYMQYPNLSPILKPKFYIREQIIQTLWKMIFFKLRKINKSLEVADYSPSQNSFEDLALMPFIIAPLLCYGIIP